jgi:hypothetical protein
VKRAYLVAHDYGMGGIWMYILARSADEIRAAYPELTVFEQPPAFLSSGELDRIHREPQFDIDDDPTDYLAALVAKRKND